MTKTEQKEVEAMLEKKKAVGQQKEKRRWIAEDKASEKAKAGSRRKGDETRKQGRGREAIGKG